MNAEAFGTFLKVVGFPAALTIWFVWQGGVREREDKQKRDEQEEFIRNSLLKAFEEMSSARSETQQALEQTQQALETNQVLCKQLEKLCNRMVGLLEKIESHEDLAH